MLLLILVLEGTGAVPQQGRHGGHPCKSRGARLAFVLRAGNLRLILGAVYTFRSPSQLNYYRMSARYFGAPAAALALALFTATAANFKGDGAGSALLPTQSQNRALTFADRVAYQSAIENVYWRHRIWPKERRDSKPLLDAVLSPAEIEKKVKDYLHNCQILRDNEHQITAPQLQAEMDRMAQHTKNPEMLRELFEALGNDPFVVAECLARPALSEHLVNEFDKMNQEPGTELKQREQAWQFRTAGAKSDTATHPIVFSGYSLPALSDTASTCDDGWASLTDLPARRANHTAVWTGSEMIVFGGINYDQPVGISDRYNPATDSWSKVSLTN